MHLPQVIDHLRAVLRLAAMAPREDGSAGFRVGAIDVLLIPRPAPEAAFVARARLGRVEVADFAPLLVRLMQANFFADSVGGPALGLDADAGLFLTQHFEEGQLGLADIEAALSRFVTHAQRCQGLLAQAAPAIRH